MNYLYILIPITVAAVVLVVLLVLRAAGNKEPGEGKPASYSAEPLLNRSEKALFAHLDAILADVFGPHLRIFVQVSYGEFLRGNSRPAYARINQKRADFLIADLEGNVVLVIEYQGSGHYGRSERSREKASRNDHVKREALASAGIPLMEVPSSFDRSMVLDLLKERLPRMNTTLGRTQS